MKDTEISAFLLESMLARENIPLSELLARFSLKDKEFRESLIRLFFRGRVFGRIEGENLIFCDPTRVAIGLQEMLDWELSEFDLTTLLTQVKEFDFLQPQSREHADLKENSGFEEVLHAEITKQIDISRKKESSTEDKISIEMRLQLAGTKLKLKIFINNQAQTPISKVKLRFQLSDQLEALATIPNLETTYGDNRLVLTIPNIEATEKQRIDVFFTNSQRSNAEISGILYYTTAQGYARVVRLETIQYNLEVPQITPVIIKPEEIKPFMKDSQNSKNICALGLESFQKHEIMDLLNHLVAKFGLNHITQNESEGFAISFYYGQYNSSQQKSHHVLVIPQIKNQVISIYACCPHEYLVFNLLRQIILNFTTQLQEMKVIASPEELIDLNCIRCGAVLEGIPQKGQPITCNKCFTAQIPFRIANLKEI